MKLRLLKGTGERPSNFVPLTGWRLKLEQGLAWILWGPIRRVVDRKFRREWNAGEHRIDGREPWKGEW